MSNALLKFLRMDFLFAADFPAVEILKTEILPPARLELQHAAKWASLPVSVRFFEEEVYLRIPCVGMLPLLHSPHNTIDNLRRHSAYVCNRLSTPGSVNMAPYRII